MPSGWRRRTAWSNYRAVSGLRSSRAVLNVTLPSDVVRSAWPLRAAALALAFCCPIAPATDQSRWSITLSDERLQGTQPTLSQPNPGHCVITHQDQTVWLQCDAIPDVGVSVSFTKNDMIIAAGTLQPSGNTATPHDLRWALNIDLPSALQVRMLNPDVPGEQGKSCASWNDMNACERLPEHLWRCMISADVEQTLCVRENPSDQVSDPPAAPVRFDPRQLRFQPNQSMKLLDLLPARLPLALNRQQVFRAYPIDTWDALLVFSRPHCPEDSQPALHWWSALAVIGNAEPILVAPGGSLQLSSRRKNERSACQNLDSAVLTVDDGTLALALNPERARTPVAAQDRDVWILDVSARAYWMHQEVLKAARQFRPPTRSAATLILASDRTYLRSDAEEYRQDDLDHTLDLLRFDNDPPDLLTLAAQVLEELGGIRPRIRLIVSSTWQDLARPGGYPTRSIGYLNQTLRDLSFASLEVLVVTPDGRQELFPDPCKALTESWRSALEPTHRERVTCRTIRSATIAPELMQASKPLGGTRGQVQGGDLYPPMPPSTHVPQ